MLAPIENSAIVFETRTGTRVSVLDVGGTPYAAMPLQKAPEQVKYSTLAHVGESRFVVAMSGYEIGRMAEFYQVDFDAATVKTRLIRLKRTLSDAGRRA